MKKGKLSKWFKKEGDKVKEGEDLFEVETEKITNKVQSVAGGILFQIVVSEGMTVPVGTIVAVIADPDEQPARIEGIQMGEIVELAAPSKEKQVPATSEKPKERKFVLATPGARRLAKELGVDLAIVSGTGSGGSVVEADVKRFHEEGLPVPRITPLAEEMANQEGLDITSISGTGEDGRITKEDVERALRAKGQAGEELESPPRQYRTVA